MTKVLEDPRACWESLQGEYRAAFDALDSFNRDMAARYGTPSDVYATRREQNRGIELRQREHEAYDAIIDWLDKFATRDFHYGIPAQWVCRELTYADATTTGPMQATPPLAYGMTRPDPRWSNPV